MFSYFSRGLWLTEVGAWSVSSLPLSNLFNVLHGVEVPFLDFLDLCLSLRAALLERVGHKTLIESNLATGPSLSTDTPRIAEIGALLVETLALLHWGVLNGESEGGDAEKSDGGSNSEAHDERCG